MTQFKFDRGLWSLRPQTEWTEQEKALHVDMLMAGQGTYLSDELCRLNEDAQRQGYRRARIGSNRYGVALFDSDATADRISEIVGTVEEAVALGQEAFEVRRPGFHFVDFPAARKASTVQAGATP